MCPQEMVLLLESRSSGPDRLLLPLLGINCKVMGFKVDSLTLVMFFSPVQMFIFTPAF